LPEHFLQRELLELTKELIRIPSTCSRPQDIHRCAIFISQWLKQYDIDHQLVVNEGVPSLTVLPRPNSAPVLLLCHFDVVEVDNENLFEPFEKAGCLYGRGAIDDKYGVALSMILFREHLQQLRAQGLDQGAMPFGLLLTGDEEVGGFCGVGALCKDIAIDFFIAIDGGNPKKIVTRGKGILQLQLEVTGKAVHSARPWLGENAFDLLLEDYREIQNLFRQETPNHWHNTLVLTNCHAGNGSTNVVPGQANASLDIRYTEDSDPKELLTAIRSVVSSRVVVTALAPVFDGGVSHYLDLLIRHSEGAVPGFEHGASDARFLSDLRIPGVVWGAEGEKSQHTSDEHIVMESFFKIYDCLDGFFCTLGVQPRVIKRNFSDPLIEEN
jgi:succinyl-diaminopimelate desuccinylase